MWFGRQAQGAPAAAGMAGMVVSGPLAVWLLLHSLPCSEYTTMMPVAIPAGMAAVLMAGVAGAVVTIVAGAAGSLAVAAGVAGAARGSGAPVQGEG